jgi:hypothetical protein
MGSKDLAVRRYNESQFAFFFSKKLRSLRTRFCLSVSNKFIRFLALIVHRSLAISPLVGDGRA